MLEFWSFCNRERAFKPPSIKITALTFLAKKLSFPECLFWEKFTFKSNLKVFTTTVTQMQWWKQKLLNCWSSLFMSCLSCERYWPGLGSVSFPVTQSSYRSWKTWKSLNLRISFSRHGKLWNLIVSPGKSWKILNYISHRLVTADVKARTTM